jgi:hypothetical protein
MEHTNGGTHGACLFLTRCGDGLREHLPLARCRSPHDMAAQSLAFSFSRAARVVA